MYVSVNVSIASEDLCSYSRSQSFKRMSEVSGLASRRGVACHTRPVHPDPRGQTPATAGHWVRCVEPPLEMSYNHHMTGKHGRCVKINLWLNILSNARPGKSLRITVAAITRSADDMQGLVVL